MNTKKSPNPHGASDGLLSSLHSLRATTTPLFVLAMVFILVLTLWRGQLFERSMPVAVALSLLLVYGLAWLALHFMPNRKP